MADLIAEEADAAALFAGREDEVGVPDDARWPEWALHIRSAWMELRDDRHFGQMGGVGRIYSAAISAYAERAGMAGASFENFRMFVREIDDEFVAWAHEQARDAAEKAKNKN